MAPLDSSIYGQLQPNIALGMGDIVNRYVDQTQADADRKNKLAMLAQQGQMQELQLQQAKQQAADEAAVRQAYKEAGGDITGLPQKLRAAGYHTQAAQLEKQMAEQGNLMREAAIKRHDAMTTSFSDVANNPTQYQTIIENNAKSGLLHPDDAKFMLGKFSTMPPEEIAKNAKLGAVKASDYSAQVAKELYSKPQATSAVGKLIEERDALPQGDPRRAVYDAAIKKETEKPDNTLVAVVGPDGTNPVLVPRSQAAGQQPYVKGSVTGGVNENSPSYKAGLAELKRDETVVQQGVDLQNAYNRWRELNSQIETGPISGRRPISFDPKYQELQQLQNYFSMNNFKPGQGQMSNAERVYIRGAGPQTTNDVKTNESIIGVKLGALQNQQDMYNFKEWRLQTKGNLLGANKEFQDYIEKNPRFVKDKNGELVPNPNRVDWTDYFQNGKQNTEQTKPETNPLSVKAPDGSVHVFPSKAAADGFRKAIGVQ